MLRGGGEALQGDEEVLNDNGKASKGNWEAFRSMQKRYMVMESVKDDGEVLKGDEKAFKDNKH